jgi:hypothetical protein
MCLGRSMSSKKRKMGNYKCETRKELYYYYFCELSEWNTFIRWRKFLPQFRPSHPSIIYGFKTVNIKKFSAFRQQFLRFFLSFIRTKIKIIESFSSGLGWKFYKHLLQTVGGWRRKEKFMNKKEKSAVLNI